MTFIESVSSCFRKYGTFSGRASRSEFWFFILFLVILGTITTIIEAKLYPPPEIPGEEVFFAIGFRFSLDSPVSAIFTLLCLPPLLSVTARRLHDGDKSGWWQIIRAAPVLIVIPFVITGVEALFFIGFVMTIALFILVLIWLIKKGTDGEYRFGRDPLS